MVSTDKAPSTLRQRGKSTTTPTKDAALSTIDDDENDDGIVIVNGKKYRKRQDLRDMKISDMLAYGAPDSPHHAYKSWGELVRGPLILALLFGASLLAFHHALPYMSKRNDFKLPKFGSESMPTTTSYQQPPPSTQDAPRVPRTRVDSMVVDSDHKPKARSITKNEPVPLEDTNDDPDNGSSNEPQVPMPSERHQAELPQVETVYKHEPVPLDEY